MNDFIKKTELLAPAKNIEIAKAAIDAGADAVYIGADNFGARVNAANSLDDIKDLVDYAHKFYVKIMVTVNTIIKDSEIKKVKTLIKNLYNIGVDALIIQDMAILKWAIDGDIPPIPLHISTQCDNRYPEKIDFFQRIGLSRVVLARELSINQIKDIIDKNPQIEIETFAHGALCVSYSGQCYMSHFIGGRSANRGECAQPCRKKYSVVDEFGNTLINNKHVLCLKDFNSTKYIKNLVDIGVKSFKIEGRLKDINYVKNVVGYYRNLLDKYSLKTSSGISELNFTPDIYKTFNRGYTTYFLNGRENCFNFQSPKFRGEKIGVVDKIRKNYFTIKPLKGLSFILSAQDGLTFSESAEIGCLINKVVDDKIYPNKFIPIESGMEVYRNIDSVFEKSLACAKIKRQILTDAAFVKNNNNVFLVLTDEDNNEISIIIVENEKANNSEKNIENIKKAFMKTGESDFKIRTLKIETDLPFLPISKMNEYRRIALDMLMAERIKNYKREVQKPLKYDKYFLSELDYKSNIYNKDAVNFYEKCSAKVVEYAFEKEKPKHEIELMRTKHCIKYALGICKSNKKLFLVDEKGKNYKLKFDCNKCEMIITY